MSASRDGRLYRRRGKTKGRGLRTAPHRRFSRLEQLEQRRLLVADLDTFLTDQHVDLSLQHEAGQWKLAPIATEAAGEVQYENDQALLYVGSPSVVTLPEVSGYDFLGVAPGESYYVLPQSYAPDVLFLGLSGEGLDDTVDRYNASAESKGRLVSEARWAKATLSDVRHTNPDGSTGTGEFSLWVTTAFGEPGVLISSYDDGISNPDPVSGLDTTDGITTDDAVWITAGSHAHYNFGFSEPGRYEVDLTLSAYFGDDGQSTPNADGFSQSDPITLYFSVESVGKLAFDAASYSVDEDAGSVSIDVIRTGGSDGRIMADYATSDGTADSGDYTSVSGTVEFADGETRKTISIPILDDTDQEFDESFGIELSAAMPASIDGYLQAIEGATNGLLGTVTSATVTIRANGVSFGVAGIEESYMPGDIMQARIAGVTLEEGQEIQWRIRPIGTDFGGTVLSRFVPETDTAEARAGRLDMQLDASYDGYELVASVMEGEQAIATTEWAGPISVSNAVEPLSLTYVGPSPYLLGETASLEATGRDLADGESLRVVSNTFFSHYSLWLPPFMGYHQTGDRTFAFEPPSRSAYPLALQVIRDELVVAQSEPIEVERSLIETFFSGMQPVYRAGQTFSATFTVVPDLGDEVTYSWAMYDDYENPMKVAQGEEGRTFEMPVTADMDGARMFIQARVAYESGNDALIGGFYPYLTVIDDPSAQLFLFSSLPGHFHQGEPVDLQLFADPGLVEGDSIAWEWRWPGMDWETLPGAQGLSHQFTGEQGMDGLEVRATLTFADSEFDPMLAGPVTIYIDDHGAAPLQQLTISGETAYTAGDQVTLTRALPANVVTLLNTHRWERKAADESEFSPVEGQTGATLSFAATLADEGAQYRVSILKPDGTVAYGPSPSVVLSVTSDPLPRVVVPFALPEVVSTAPDGPVGADVADFDGDGDADLLVPSFGSVSWLPLDGGTFGTATQVAGVGADDALAGDLDGDGDQDVIVAESGVGLAWYPNDGSGTFGDRQMIVDLAGVSPGFLGLALADLDGDGDLDAVANSQEPGQITWYANDGDGSFGLAGTLPFEVPFTFRLDFADLDGDGDLDVAAANFPSNSIFWAANDGSGNFGSPQTVSSELSGSFNVIAVDLDGDADYDLVSSSYDNKVALYKNDGSGSFGPQQVLTTAVLTPLALTAEDLDGDSSIDLLVGSGANGEVVWLPGNGLGEFEAARTIASTGGTAVMATPVVDLDEDGDKDVLAAVYAEAVMSIESRIGESATAVFEPAEGTYRTGQFVDVGVYYGSPVTVTGSPVIPATVGGGAVEFMYVSGSGTNTLTFRYVVPVGATDTDGVELGTMIDPNGGSLVDVVGETITGDGLSVPATDLSDVLVDGVAPLVTSITRNDANPTAAHSVSFSVEFDQSVSGVDVADFDVTADGVTGAAVTGVEGSGAMYVVTVGTGTGTGTIRLDVLSEATITNDGGSSLGSGFTGGQVYTLHRRPERTLSNFYTSGHGDLGVDFVDGKWDLSLHLDDPEGVYPAGELLIVSGPSSAEPAPTGSEWDFLGESDDTVFVLPAAPTPDLPFVGLGAEETTPGTFAAYLETDPRVGATSRWIRLDLTDVRGPAGGEFSMYSIGSEGPRVWMASSDGIGTEDTYWLRERSHDHTFMAFTEPGFYEIDVVASGFLDANGNGTLDPGVDPYTESGVTTLYFQVNESGEPTPVTLPADPPSVPLPPVPFSLPITAVDVGGNPLSAVAADLDRDGNVDILTGGYYGDGDGDVLWSRNLGGGVFAPHEVVGPGLGIIYPILVADYDNDGDNDIVAGNYAGKLVLFENQGGEAFAAERVITDGELAEVSDAEAVDVDQDGDLDIVTYSGVDGSVVWFANRLNEASNDFGPLQTISADAEDIFQLVVADYDNDGDLDVASANFDAVKWYENLGGGTSWTTRVISSDDKGYWDVDVADLDDDGDADLIVAALDENSVVWFENQGGGTFGPERVISADVGRANNVVAADFNGDGRIDVLATGFDGLVSWSENLGGGAFRPRQMIANRPGSLPVAVGAVDIDADGDADVFAAEYSRDRVSWYGNQLGEFATEVVAPPSRTYLVGQNLDVTVHFGFPVAVTGSPSVPLNIGGNTVQAVYDSGAGTPDLVFRYTITATEIDADGITMAAGAVALNGGALTDPYGNPVPLGMPLTDLSGVKVNGSAPGVTGITRLDPTPTNAGIVRFQVTFNEPVTGVDVADFGLSMDGLTGATVTGVSGSGSEYVVTASTGAGSGTLGLTVLSGATILDPDGYALGEGFSGGEVFTLNRRPERVVDKFYTEGHGDIVIDYADGTWDLHVHADMLGEDLAPDEVLIYGGPESLTAAPQGPEWAFLGAEPGADIYVWPQSGQAGVPGPGLASEGIAAGTFAAYASTDPRVNDTDEWLRLQAVAVRGPAGGHVSIYQTSFGELMPWVASSDGLTSEDSVFVRAGIHTHYSWAFTKPGVYEVDFVVSGFLDTNGSGTYEAGIDRYTESGVTTLYFQVNESGEPTPVTLPADPLEQRLVGDTDDDGDVDLADFVVLKNNFAKAVDAVWGDGDFNFDGSVDLTDFEALKENFGTRRMP